MTAAKGPDGERWADERLYGALLTSAPARSLDRILLDSAAEVARERRARDPLVTVVVPTLNEAENLPFVLSRIDPDVHEVLVVDGGSEDGTTELARRLHPRVRTLVDSGRGKGDALRTGFRAATGDIIVTIDADGSADPWEIPAFVGALRAGADFAKGSRFLQGAGTADMPFYRRLGNSAFVHMVRLLFGGHYSDLCYGYNAFWRDVLPRLQLDSDGFEIETMMNIRALRAGLLVVEVASFESCRAHGIAKLRTIPDGWRVLKAILRERFTRLPAEGSVRRTPVTAESRGDVPEDGLADQI
ncbi:MAG TPA: glycosyltransferase family 2 protein [Gaiellaceae bacterium]|nr:glycosyltransferase family 2 protein [Gaiellaceae bacterium]